jgi:hypothetical protein
MHYVTDEKARRRIVRPVGPGSSPLTGTDPNLYNLYANDVDDERSPLYHDHGDQNEYDDGGKAVYGKIRVSHALNQIPRPPPTTFQEDLLENLPAAIYTLLSCWTRFYQIGRNNHVVWDEAHFGKFGSYYLRVCIHFASLYELKANKTISVNSISTSTRRSAKYWLVSLDSYQVITAILNSSPANNTQMMYHTLQCV